MEDPRRLRLPDDVLADVLARLAPRSLAVSRCVCREWRAVVDERCLHLLRPEDLLLTVGGIFVQSYRKDAPDFFARPSTARTTGWVAGRWLESFVQMVDAFVYTEIVDCCNGLLLLEGYKMYSGDEIIVVNPATRRSARLGLGHDDGCRSYYLAFDPTVSPHYEVISMQYLFTGGDEGGKPLEQELQWPPPVCVMHAYSSRTGSWEERRFAFEDHEGLSRTIDRGGPWGHAPYWRGVLYVHCNIHIIFRINLSDDKYQVIDLPAIVSDEFCTDCYLGKSKNGIYFAAIIKDPWRVLVWFLDESVDKVQWTLKHSIKQHDLITHLWGNPDAQTNLQDSDSQKEFQLGPGVEVEKNLRNLDWESDQGGLIRILGFHPYKEIVFLHSSTVMAYHFGTSKVQDLGDLCCKLSGKRYIGHTAFIYAPCWIGDLSENS